jgi:ATP/maltotriose-dependent transcriptional regulator MalT
MASSTALYGGAITDALAAGDLAKLQSLQTEAEAHLKNYGDIPTLLALLKIEIAKLESR